MFALPYLPSRESFAAALQQAEREGEKDKRKTAESDCHNLIISDFPNIIM